MEQKKRLKKFVREKGITLPMDVQPRDIEILKSLADHRFLNTQHIIALHGGGPRNILRRLQKLFKNGYIERPRQQASLTGPQGYMVHAIGNKGVDLLCEHFPDFKKTKVDWLTKNKEVREHYIHHALMISNFRVVLNLALRNDQEAKLSQWQQGRELRDYVKFEGRKVAVVPDAFFTLEDREDRMYFFLEADRSTMVRLRFLRKMRAYWQWWKEEGHQKKFGIENFRVLTLCKGDGRKEILRQITKEADDKKVGSLMFWFCTEKDFDLSDPESILNPIWQTPKDDSFHSLLE